jgi:putative cell wall-binding protein/V8-like Glu-specific endopeptidase
MHRPIGRVATLVAVLVAAMVAGPSATVASGPVGAARASALAHWTEARMRAAVPLEVTLEAGAAAVLPTPASMPATAAEPASAPWDAGGAIATRTGRVFLTLGASDYTCSGTIISDDGDPTHSLVLTAAHCVYDNEAGVWASDWIFVPDWDAAPTYQCSTVAHDCWAAEALVIHAGYEAEDGLTVAAAQHDYAVAVVGNGLSKGSQLDSLGGYPVRIGSVPAGTDADIFGYPAVPPFAGDDLVHCAGTVAVSAQVGGWSMPCDMTAGASGGPWLHGSLDPSDGSGSVGSVSSYRIAGDPRLYGPRFDGSTQAVIDLAEAAVPDGGIIDHLVAVGWAPQTVSRLAGPDRFATAVAISQATFPAPPVPVVYVATGRDFPDALAGGPAAALEGGPVLLVTRDAIPPVVAAELTRLQPGAIRILGGSAVVSDAVRSALGAFTTGGVTRLDGPDRYATAAKVVETIFAGHTGPVFVAFGGNFPDALSGGAAAAAQGAPIVLARSDDVPDRTMAALAKLTPTRFILLGGSAVLGSQVASELLARYPGIQITRWSGPDRYGTSASIASNGFADGADVVYLTTGLNFPDALAGVPAAERDGAPVLLTRSTCLPPVIAAELDRLEPLRIVILGGPVVVSDSAVTTVCEG